MGLKELFSKLRKRKSEEEQIPAEASTEAPIEVPTEVKEYKPAPIPADAPACWEKAGERI